MSALRFSRCAGAGAAASSIEGHWRSPGGNSIIAIAPCGSGLCGTIAWASDKAKQDRSKTTQPAGRDAAADQPQQDKNGRWQGKLFIPDKNMRVTAKIQLVGEQQLRVSGCAVGKTLCKRSTGTRFRTGSRLRARRRIRQRQHPIEGLWRTRSGCDHRDRACGSAMCGNGRAGHPHEAKQEARKGTSTGLSEPPLLTNLQPSGRAMDAASCSSRTTNMPCRCDGCNSSATDS